MKLRLKHVHGIGYFAQVKHSFFSPWKKIGKHTTGFGLYPSNCLDHPLENEYLALMRCSDYREWLTASAQKPTYRVIPTAD